jgi:hypothetical protein
VNIKSGTSTKLIAVETSESKNLNSNTPSFAMVSIVDSSLKEIIGVDRIGNVYFWTVSLSPIFNGVIKISKES